MDNIPQDYRAGYAAIIGYPNAGKSTLMNALLNIKLSIISAKPQTTRRRVLGIMNKEEYQVVFIDTPGILKPRYHLQTKMMEYVQTALDDADLLLIIVDAADSRHPAEFDLTRLNRRNNPALLILNKADLLSKEKLLPIIEIYSKLHPFKAIIPVSALKNDGIEHTEKEILKHIPPGYPFYPPDVITDQPERFFVSEIIREKIFEMFSQEVPYSTEVFIETFKEREKGKDYISATINVERKSQKGILIGKKGAALKRIGESARMDIEQFLGRNVYLDLRVKVVEGWRKSDIKLKRLGF